MIAKVYHNSEQIKPGHCPQILSRLLKRATKYQCLAVKSRYVVVDDIFQYNIYHCCFYNLERNLRLTQ